MQKMFLNVGNNKKKGLQLKNLLKSNGKSSDWSKLQLTGCTILDYEAGTSNESNPLSPLDDTEMIGALEKMADDDNKLLSI